MSTMSTITFRRRACACLVACLLTSATGRAFSQAAPTDAGVDRIAVAEAYAADAYEAYAGHDYETAVKLYEKALNAAPSADILYNLARIHDRKLRHRSAAIGYYERYLNDTGADPARARDVQARLQVLRELEDIAEHANRQVPAERASRTAPAPAPVEPAVQRVEPTTGQTARADGDPGMSGGQLSGVVVAALGLAGVGLGVGFGLAAKTDADEAHRLCDGNACSAQAGVDAAERADDRALASTIAFAAGGTLIAAGLGLWVFTGPDDSHEQARITVTPVAAANLIGATAAGRF